MKRISSLSLLTVLLVVSNAVAQLASSSAQAEKLGQERKVRQGVAYYSAQRPLFPPWPVNPFPDLPVYEIKPGQFIYDDSKVDYKQLEAEAAAEAAKNRAQTAPAGNGPEGGGNNLMDSNGNDLRLCIELIDGEVKRMSFNTVSAVVYYVEESTNLVDWSLLKQIVADDTNMVFRSFDSDIRFYRVRQGDDRIQFPNWGNFIEQFAYFDVWTSIVGTYTLQLYGDGALLYQTTQPVPPGGNFGVYDGNYDPAQWPYAGYYDIAEWELSVTVAPAAGGGEQPAPAQVAVKKEGRRRPHTPPYEGITVQHYGVVSNTGSAQEDLDQYMEVLFAANYQAAYQVDLDDALLDISAVPTPAIHSTNDWTRLRTLITDTRMNYFHYFGHGSKSLIGNAGNYPNSQITSAQLSRTRLTNDPMNYVILDGCRGAENPDLLEAFMFFPKVIPRNTFLLHGWIPRFGASWKGTKRIEFAIQGTLVHDHFYFWVDYYAKLTTERDGVGFMIRSYKEAYEFAKDPNGMGVNPGTNHNLEAGGFVPQGCYQCLFDE